MSASMEISDMSKTTVNLNSRIIKALQTGQDFSANQLRARFGIKRVGEKINQLRKAGYSIYLNPKTTANGRKMQVYRLGTPTRRDIAELQYVREYGYLPMYDSEVKELNDRLSVVK
jgi:biotin operon repressor